MKIIRSEAGKRGGWEAWRPGGDEKMNIEHRTSNIEC
jgi:hypothetical protein